MSLPSLLELTQPDTHHLKFVWEDGSNAVISNFDLRFACPCAKCVNEITGERMLSKDQIFKDVQPSAIETVGNYALNFKWSDGHETGIYPYALLYGLSQRNLH